MLSAPGITRRDLSPPFRSQIIETQSDHSHLPKATSSIRGGTQRSSYCWRRANKGRGRGAKSTTAQQEGGGWAGNWAWAAWPEAEPELGRGPALHSPAGLWSLSHCPGGLAQPGGGPWGRTRSQTLPRSGSEGRVLASGIHTCRPPPSRPPPRPVTWEVGQPRVCSPHCELCDLGQIAWSL